MSSAIQGVIMFLFFKLTQKFWDRVYPEDVLEARVDYLEDKIHMILEDKKDD